MDELGKATKKTKASTEPVVEKEEKTLDMFDSSPLNEDVIEHVDKEFVNNPHEQVHINKDQVQPQSFQYDDIDDIDIPNTSNPTSSSFNDFEDNSISGSNNKEQAEIDPQMARDQAELLADMFLKGAEMVLPEMAENYYKINENKIKALASQDKLPNEAVDTVKEINKSNKGRVKFDSQKQNYIRKPLVQVLTAKGVNADPSTLLIIAIVVVMGMMFFQANSIRKENNELVEKMINGWTDKLEKDKKDKESIEKRDKIEDAVVIS